jgi:hypothetical protein
MEPEDSLPHSKELSTCPYPQPDQSSPHHSNLALKRSILILSTHLRLDLPNCFFPWQCNFLHPPVTASLFCPNILLSTLFSITLSLCSSFTVRDQVSHPYRTTGMCFYMFRQQTNKQTHTHTHTHTHIYIYIYIYTCLYAGLSRLQPRILQCILISMFFFLDSDRDLCIQTHPRCLQPRKGASTLNNSTNVFLGIRVTRLNGEVLKEPPLTSPGDTPSVHQLHHLLGHESRTHASVRTKSGLVRSTGSHQTEIRIAQPQWLLSSIRHDSQIQPTTASQQTL